MAPSDPRHQFTKNGPREGQVHAVVATLSIWEVAATIAALVERATRYTLLVQLPDLSTYGPEDLEHVAQQLNGRPRKTLDWETPAERLRGLLQTT